ncbi:ester cyclase [Pseudosulfitobacter sp. SM2401]|jgi:hypothetical protein|uniref:ester cyclase n=1 Tax=Pseudosulfitobacter sp. SM2401 TaxID=3350098 RepID=UPI0036F2EB56
MMTSDKQTLLKNWYQEVWVDANLDAISKYMAPNGKAVGIFPDLVVPPDDMRDLISLVRPILDKMSFEFRLFIEQDDWLSAIVDAHCTCAHRGKPVNVISHVAVRIEDNKIAEMYNSFDSLSFFEQLGQLPPDSLALMLSGTKIG